MQTPIISDLNPPQKVIEHQTTFSTHTMDTQMLEGILDDKPRFNRGLVFGCLSVATLIIGFFYLSPGGSTETTQSGSDEVIVEPEVVAEAQDAVEMTPAPKELLNNDSMANLAFAGRQPAEAAPVAMPATATKAQFAYDSSHLTADAKIGLKSLVAKLKSDKTMHFRIEGHADERGSRKYNYRLGLRRANAVKAFLVRNGISAKRLTVVSYGETRPVKANAGKYAANRRVEWRSAATLLSQR